MGLVLKEFNNKIRTALILAPFFTFAQIVIDLIIPSFLASAISVVFSIDKLKQDESGGKTISVDFIGGANINFANVREAQIVLATTVILLALCGLFFGLISIYCASYVSANTSFLLRKKIFAKLMRITTPSHDHYGSSTLLVRLTNDVYLMEVIAFDFLRLIIRAPLLFIGGLVFAVTTNQDMSISLLITFPLILLVIGILNRKSIPLFKENQKSVDKINERVEEDVSGYKVIQSFNLHSFTNNKFKIANEGWKKNSTSSLFINSLNIPFTFFLSSLTIIIALLLVFQLDSSVSVDPLPQDAAIRPNIFAFFQYNFYIVLGFILTSLTMVNFNRSRVALGRIKDILSQPEIKTITNKDQKELLPTLEFRNISFGLGNKNNNNFLQNLSFKFEAYKTYGIVGPTGSGKSLIANIIGGLYEPNEGEILIGGEKIQSIDSLYLSEMIGIVFQQNILFKGTISSNIKIGIETRSDWKNQSDLQKNEAMKNAAKIACADTFIEKFSDSYDHNVEQLGKNLSGGQKQRVAIARTLITKPRILVFDDSMSALDALTEKKVRENIENDLKLTTKIIISQNINSIKHADKILVIDNGRIVGFDSDQKLMKNCSLYQKMKESQKDLGGDFDAVN
ncbi:ABC transporter ATP-binding protein [Mycoplasmoides genitalium]|uniref:Putative ABC transporter ATP-binding protein MG014 n=1 Tax=Mycoplasma genitalium (strain ATCC 33530 / DSM 19775 / NCTC 10195 / G37) TaxID=243273 RepID=Y014_MYCGE|nr:ABC transporter ATP-binding protein [Mycoplasmoides genitalium]P47260.1 RecName: Full=Putative ABC transporter ATP-binding protein MG014 [Mycoplasmoides genitalium G37]AAC71230.1 ABC transporter, ATP-binding/permease protein [Mycoplasmoides genitalium G37]ABY79331.1 ABC transporter, ATP-binding/permease protein [synthetic Mycoplasma genitalium JCVI-1.0]